MTPDSEARAGGQTSRWAGKAIRKRLRIAAGFAILIAGIVLALPLVPGPGIPLIILGLAMLAEHYVWPRKAIEWLKRRWSAFRSRAS